MFRAIACRRFGASMPCISTHLRPEARGYVDSWASVIAIMMLPPRSVITPIDIAETHCTAPAILAGGRAGTGGYPTQGVLMGTFRRERACVRAAASPLRRRAR
jgi:hypothetical protein